MNALVRTGGTLVLAAFAAASPVWAQADPPRPSSIFANVSPGASEVLGVSLSAESGYDDNTFDEDFSSLFNQTGIYEAVSATLNYAWQGEHVQVGANGGLTGRYYHTQHEFLPAGRYAGFGVAAALGRRASMYANQSAMCAPAQFEELYPTFGRALPGAVVAPKMGLELTDSRMCSYETEGRFSYGFGRRTSIEALSSVRYTTFSNDVLYRPLRSYAIGGYLLQNLTRNMRLRLGYTRRVGAYDLPLADATGRDPVEVVAHDFDFGVDYSRALSFSRRTRMTFSTGSTSLARGSAEIDRQREFALTAGVGLEHEFGRSWRAEGSYRRGISFVDGFAGPVFGNAVNMSLRGLFSRRVEFNANGAFSRGDLGQARGQFSNYLADSRLSYALGRQWAIYGEYTYYRSDFDAGTVFIGVPSALDRNVARVGVTFWLPLVAR